jgi:hypothetical protein
MKGQGRGRGRSLWDFFRFLFLSGFFRTSFGSEVSSVSHLQVGLPCLATILTISGRTGCSRSEHRQSVTS